MKKDKPMQLETLNDLFVQEIKDLYSAETQLLKALPKMVEAASAPELKEAFEDHLAETEIHVARLEKICETLNISPKGKKCAAMEGLITEGSEIIAIKGKSPVKDAALIAAAQRVEHYEMAGYGCVRTFANTLGFTEEAEILQETLDEEGNADKRLTELAESIINVDAEAVEES